jgi:hypothetical protein
MKFMKFKKIIFVGLFVTLVASCSKDLDPLLINPNQPTPSTADVDLYLNAVEINFNSFWLNVSDYSAELTRQQVMTGSSLYNNAYSPQSFDGIWNTAYTRVIKNADALIPIAKSQNKFVQSGIAKALKAFTIGTLIDIFGDVPVSQANLGVDNTSPGVDGGAAGYAVVQTLLDSAISDFAKTTPAAVNTKTDLFYNGSASRWTTLAKTLKLKFYMQARLVDNTAGAKVVTLLTENNLINTNTQDFVFQYGTNLSAPDNRHPHYAANYRNAGGPGEYMNNYFMWMVAAQKYNGTVNFNGDPRLRYYFYRQVTNYATADQSSMPCSVQPSAPAWYPSVPDKTTYCAIGRGYWGRDHGDASGTPPDGNSRTAWGIYPAGGQFDAGTGGVVSLGMGNGGNGINPIWLSSYTAFLKAEAALVFNTTVAGTAAANLTTGMTNSINKVIATPTGFAPPTATQVTNYTTLVNNNYAAATTNAERYNIILSEYYIAAWGNGLEPYNNYRRTGSPNNMQPSVGVVNPGFFIRSFFYPSVFVNLNQNAPKQKTPGVAANKVFWDNNPDNFIK